MAILFGRVSNVCRGGGGSAIKAAAYRSCSSLTLNATDKETNITVPITWSYSSKSGLVYSQIHAPKNAPEWVFDRQTLWQRVEDVETKQNARLAGEYTIALPKEFAVEQNIELLKDFAEEVFVSRGIIVDVNFHNDNPNNPHAHCMYALRELEENLDGEMDFSSHRCRQLQSRAFLEGVIKDAHKKLQNVHLEKNGFEQKLEWGVAQGQLATLHHGGMEQLFARNQEIILSNAKEIVANPTIVIDKLDFNKSVFTKEHIEKELEKALLTTFKNIAVSDQSALDIYIKTELVGLLDTVLLSPKLTLINACDLKGRMLFAKTEQVELEKRFIGNIANIANKSEHSILVKEEDIAEYAPGKEFSAQQKEAIISICGGGDLSVLEGWPGAGKSTVTKEIARHYQQAGYDIVAVAPTNKAAQELEAKLGIKVYTTAALRMKWQYQRGASKVSIGLGHDYYKQPLYDLKEGIIDKKTLFILDEASMLDVATADYFVSEVAKSGAKMLPLGDNNQNQAIGSKGAFARMSEVGNRNILTEVNRHQNKDSAIRNLHIKATEALCNYNVSKAISIYDQLGKINILENEQEKEAAISARYVSRIMEIAKNESIDIADAAKQVVISSYTNAEIKSLNSTIRDSLKNAGALVNSQEFRSGGVHGNSSMVELAVGDRIIFTRNLRDDDGQVVVLNNELATVRKLLKVDDMGSGQFVADVEGANGIRQELIETGQEGKIITFKHSYAITNNAVQGASVPYKMYSVDQYSGYSSFLVGLTRHKIDCEVYAARNTLENEVFKTKDLDVEKVKEEYKAIGYEYVSEEDENGKKIQVKADIPLWKLGLHLLGSKRNDLNFAIDSSYGSVSVELQEKLESHRGQLERLRQDLLGHEKVLGEFETVANTVLIDTEIVDKANQGNKHNTGAKNNKTTKGSSTQFELFAAQHFELKENIIFDIADVMEAPMNFKNNNISSDGKQLKIEDHLSSLKAGIITDSNTSRLNWADLPKKDQDLLLWSYIDKEDRSKLEHHYSSTHNLTEEIQDKADSASEIWKELEESGFKSNETLNGNYAVVRDYLAARVRVRESFEKDEIFNKQLISAKIQKLLITEIQNKYSLKLKFIHTNISSIDKAKNDFANKNTCSYPRSFVDIEKDRELYLRSLKKADFKEILQNSNLFVADILSSAKEGSVLSDLNHSIREATTEALSAKEERQNLAGLIIENWEGHIDEDAAKDQPSFERISSQMSFNRLTLLKHAGLNQEKHYFTKLFNPTLGKNSDYQEVMHAIFKVGDSKLTANDISRFIKAHDGLCEHVELVSEYIEELKEEKYSVQDNLNSGKARLKEIEIYQKTELPYFMETIYKEDSKIIISKLDQLLAKTNDKAQLGAVISNNPDMLGDLKAHGLISKIFGSEEKRAVEANLNNLGNRIGQYIKGKDEMQALKQGVVDGQYANKLIEIDNEIGVLRSSLPNANELNLLEEIGGLQDSVLKSGTKQSDIIKFSKQINKLLLADNAQDALFAYQTKHNIIFESKRVDADKVSTDMQPEATISNISGDELKQQFKQKANRSTKQKMLQKRQDAKPSLTFNEVKAGLNQSVVSEIFRHYGTAIVPSKPIEKVGSNLKVGTLSMSTSGDKIGLWHRFSSGGGGDIFSFVQEATGCSKHESLEIVASHAGITATVKDALHGKARIGAATQNNDDKHNSTEQVQKDLAASTIVPESAAKFNAAEDLSFLIKKGNVISLVHEYKNKDNQLLGYTVRVEDSKTGKKQVLPVAYGHSEILDKSCWHLKGFSDAGTKPIYGLEKLAQNSNKPIVIVEGEKTADAASKLLPDHNVISWMGGAQAVDKVDWSKISNRVVSIWPDNDKPGIDAAKNITNHIDCHNGFSGLVSIVDTERLNLPDKWDLADKLPGHLEIVGAEQLLEKTVNMPKRITVILAEQPSKDVKQALSSIDMLESQGRIDKDQYICKETYNSILAAIATNKNIDLLSSPKEFVNNIRNLQEDYRDLQKYYQSNSTHNKSKPNDAKKELEQQLVADTSILHMAQLNKPILTTTHTEHIEEAAKQITKDAQHFASSDKSHIAGKMHKEVNTDKWRDELEKNQQDKANFIKLVAQEKQKEALSIPRSCTNISEQKEEARTPAEAIAALGKENDYLKSLSGNIKYPNIHDKALVSSVKEAEATNTVELLELLQKNVEVHQKQGIKTEEEIVKMLLVPSDLKSLSEAVVKDSDKVRKSVFSWHEVAFVAYAKVGGKVDDSIIKDLHPLNLIEQTKFINKRLSKKAEEHVKEALSRHIEEKSEAKTIPEQLHAISKEQETYMSLKKTKKNPATKSVP